MKLISSIILTVIIVILATIWQWGLNGPVLSFGNPSKTYFMPSKTSPGDTIKLCMDDITWYKICPSKTVTYLQPPLVHRRDFPNHDVSVPKATGKVPPKCRPFIVPDVVDINADGSKTEGYGLAKFSIHTVSYCTLTVITTTPDIDLEIVKK